MPAPHQISDLEDFFALPPPVHESPPQPATHLIFASPSFSMCSNVLLLNETCNESPYKNSAYVVGVIHHHRTFPLKFHVSIFQLSFPPLLQRQSITLPGAVEEGRGAAATDTRAHATPPSGDHAKRKKCRNNDISLPRVCFIMRGGGVTHRTQCARSLNLELIDQLRAREGEPGPHSRFE